VRAKKLFSDPRKRGQGTPFSPSIIKTCGRFCSFFQHYIQCERNDHTKNYDENKELHRFLYPFSDIQDTKASHEFYVVVSDVEDRTQGDRYDQKTYLSYYVHHITTSFFYFFFDQSSRYYDKKYV
jgi:hypothetical protein